MAKVPQLSLSAGELTPSLHARADLARYLVSLRTCRNFRVLPTGGVANREGTRYVLETKDSGQPRLIPFIFSTEQAYVLEFGEGYITPFANESPLGAASGSVTSIFGFGGDDELVVSLGTPAVGLSLGSRVIFSGVTPDGFKDINGVHIVSSFTSVTDFSIPNPFKTLGGFIGSTGTAAALLEISNPYTQDELEDLKWTQSADVLTVVHPDHPPHEFRRLSASSFEFEEIDFQEGPFSSVNDDETLFVHASASLGTVTLTATQGIFQPAHVGALFYLEQRDGSIVAPWEPNRRLTAVGVNCFGILRRSDQKTYQCVTNFSPVTNEVISGTVRPTHDRGVAPDGNGEPITGGAERGGVDWLYLDSGFGIFRITAYSGPTSVTAEVLTRPPSLVVGGATTGVGPFAGVGDGVTLTLAVAGATSGDPTKWEVTLDGVIQPFDSYSVNATTDVLTFAVAPAVAVVISARQLSQNNRSDLWAFGAWSEANGYPSEVEYYSDRIIYAATYEEPQTLWMSRVSDYRTFVTSRPVVDDDPVTGTINARQVNRISNIVPLDSLLVLTEASEWRATGGADDVITPTAVGFRPQSYNGVNRLRVQILDDSGLYVQVKGPRIRDLTQNFNSEGEVFYSGTDLSVTADHLMKQRTIKDWAYQAHPGKVVWIVRDDGILLSLTYFREHQVVGWAPHSLGGDALVRQVCVIPENNEDALYLVVERQINGSTKRYIERLSSRDYDHIRDSIFMDSALSFDGRNTNLSLTMTLFTIGAGGWTTFDQLNLVASSPTFISSLVGNAVVFHYGANSQIILHVDAHNSSTSLTVTPSKNIPVELQAIATNFWAYAFKEFAGLEHQEGLEVVALADANVVRGLTVSNAKTTLPNPAVVVHIGLPYNADIETLDLTVPGGYIRGSAKNIPSVDVLVEESRGFLAGPNENNLLEYKIRDENDNYDPIEPRTGLAPINVPCTWSKDARVFIRQSDPLPLTVNAIIPEAKVGTSG